MSIPNVAGLPMTGDTVVDADNSNQARSKDRKSMLRMLHNTPLHTFVRSKNAQLFGNAVMRTMLNFKWKTYAEELFMR